MTFRTFRIAAFAAALTACGGFAAHAASDDEIKYRDGKPVNGAQTTESGSAEAKPMKPRKAKAMKKKKSGKAMKRGASIGYDIRHA